MSDQSTDPPRTPAVSSGIQTTANAGAEPASSGADSPTEATILPSGDTVTVSLDPQGSPVEVIDVAEGTHTASSLVETPMPSAEYGYRPEPIPGPSVEELKLMATEGYPQQPSAQELIMSRAQAQADAIVKAAEDAVAAMDKMEADAAKAAEDAAENG